VTTHIPRITPATTAEFYEWLDSIHFIDVPTDLPMRDDVPILAPEPSDPDDEPDDEPSETTPRHH